MAIVSAGPAGFKHSPVTKLSCCSFGLVSVAFQAGKAQHIALFSESNVALRILRQQLAYSSFSQMLFGTLLLHEFRIFERRQGSRRFGSMLVLSSILTNVLVFPLSSLLRVPASSAAAILPMGVLGTLFSLYGLQIPANQEFPFIFGIKLNDKVFALSAGLVLLSGGLPTIIPAVAGAIAGLLYHYDACAMRRFRIPKAICSLCSRLFGKLLGVSKTPTIRIAARGRGGSGAGPSGGGDGSQAGANQAPPNEAHIAHLEEMGFTRTQALNALSSAGNNIDNALALLLGN